MKIYRNIEDRLNLEQLELENSIQELEKQKQHAKQYEEDKKKEAKKNDNTTQKAKP